MELKKVINEKNVDHVVRYKAWFNKKQKLLQGQQPYYLIVADPDKKLPDIIAKPIEIEDRQIIVLVMKKNKK